jgi:hypothetical protein
MRDFFTNTPSDTMSQAVFRGLLTQIMGFIRSLQQPLSPKGGAGNDGIRAATVTKNQSGHACYRDSLAECDIYVVNSAGGP